MYDLKEITLEDVEQSLIGIKRALELGETDAIRKIIHDMEWMIQEIKNPV